MKKNFLLIICLYVFSANSCYLSAQQIKVGIKAGTSIPNLHENGTNEISKGYASKVADNFGIIADIDIFKRFSIKTGIDYSGQGGIRKGLQPVTDLPTQFAQLVPNGSTIYADFDNEATLNYMEIPVMGKFEWGNKLKYYVNAGPYIGFLLNAKQVTSGNSLLYLDKSGSMPLAVQGQTLPSQSFYATTNIKDDIRSTNYGLTLGIGLSYCVNNISTVSLDARGARGLKSIQKDTSVNGDSRAGGLFLTIGWVFSFINLH